MMTTCRKGRVEMTLRPALDGPVISDHKLFS
jgi:hypothetical protein